MFEKLTIKLSGIQNDKNIKKVFLKREYGKVPTVSIKNMPWIRFSTGD